MVYEIHDGDRSFAGPARAVSYAAFNVAGAVLRIAFLGVDEVCHLEIECQVRFEILWIAGIV